MSFIDRILTLTKQLYPTGRAYKMPSGFDFDKLHRSLTKSEDRAYTDANSILKSLLPDNDGFTAEDASAWERRLGMITNTGLDLETRKAAIIRKINHPGTIKARQAALYLQNQLQAAGFDVYVHEKTVASGTTLNSFKLGQRNLGGANYASGEIVANHIDSSADQSFDVPTQFQLVFYIANENLDGSANVPASRKSEFRQLILKVKPQHTIGLLFINYT